MVMIDFGDTKQINRTPLCTFELLITIMKNEGKELDKMNIQELLLTLMAQPKNYTREELPKTGLKGYQIMSKYQLVLSLF